MDFVTPFLLGLFGSFHCMGMCGPIVLALPHRVNTTLSKAIDISLYSLGKTTSYVAIGVLSGLLGAGFFISGFQKYLSVTTGIVMIISVLLPIVLKRRIVNLEGLAVFSYIKNKFRKFLAVNTRGSMLVIGLLNGLLPCGLVYVAVALALVSGSTFEGSMTMLLFGVGTIPVLTILYFLKSISLKGMKKRLSAITGFLVIIVGVLMILRGLSLGIPYISPADSNLEPHTEKHGCCASHKSK